MFEFFFGFIVGFLVCRFKGPLMGLMQRTETKIETKLNETNKK